MLSRLPALFCLGLALTSCLGCWDVDEINRRATVVGLGLDEAPGGKVAVSNQIPLLEVSTSPAGGLPTGKPFGFFTATADMPFAATPELQSKTHRGLFYGQIKVIVISAGVARRGLHSSADFLSRHPEIPPQAFVVLTPGPATDILDVTLASRVLPSVAIMMHLSSPVKGDRAFAPKTWEFVRALNSDRSSAYLPIIAFSRKDEAFNIKGMGVFNRDKLVGQLSPDEARMFGLLSGKTRNGYLEVDVGGGEKAVFRNVRSKCAIRTLRSRLGFSADIRAVGFLVEATSAAPQLTRRESRSMQTRVERHLTAEIRRLVARLQSMGSDPIGFGEYVRAKQPGIWKRIDWRKVYPKVPIRVRVKFTIQRAGTYR